MPAYRRSEIVSEDEVSTYHCISRCVRRAFLCGLDAHSGQNYEHRKAWFLELLALLTSIFAVELGHYAIMDNHYHLQLTIRPDQVRQWSDEEVVDRWWRLYPKRGQETLPEAIRQSWLADPEFLATRRRRLSNLSWFMKCLNEPIAKRANREDGVTGTFWQGRFISKRVLDENAVRETGIYIDLNPIKAGIATSVEESENTSVQERLMVILGDRSLRLVVPIRAVLGQLEEQAPYLLEDEKDYVALVRARAEGILEKNQLALALNHFISSCPSATGSASSLEKEAARRKRKWLKGIRLARRLIS